MDTAIDDPGSAFPGHPPDLHASQSIARVNANANNVAALNQLWLNLFERLVCDDRIAVSGRSCGSKDIQPTGGDNPDPK